MKEQNNTLDYLQELWANNLITSKEYFFRLHANQMNIKTYETK